MGLKYNLMTAEQKAQHYINTENYRAKNKSVSRNASLKYYNANKEKCAKKHREYYKDNKELVLTNQREKKRIRKLWAIDYLGGKCSACGGEFHPSIYEFHHVDPELKDKDPSKAMLLSLKKLTEELNKCVLLCANCHRFEHHGKSYGT